MTMHIEEFKLSLSGRYVPYVRDEDGNLCPVSAAPMFGAQVAFLSAPERELIAVGPRGGGKTEMLVMRYLSQINRGWGANWAGIIFRKTHPQLRDLEKLSTDLIKPVWPHARYNQLKQVWTFQSGETLEFFHFDTIKDFENIQGREFAFIGFEELSLWDDLQCYLRSFSCLRSTAVPGLPRFVGATSNPLGPAHSHIKARFRLHGVPEGVAGPAITDSVGEDGRPEPPRRAIYSSYDDNVLLRRTEPDYMRAISVACAGDPARLLAWTKGDWNVVSGGAFDSIFLEHRKTICIQPFDVPPHWSMFMSLDHGSSKPFSVGFWAESNGEDLRLADGTVMSTIRGDLFRVGEVYGSTPGHVDTGQKLPISEITKLIHIYKIKRGWRWRDPISGRWKDRCRQGVADSSIFDQTNEFSVATEYEKPVPINGQMHPGINWDPADKGPFSRRTGFQLLRQRLLATARPREEPGLFIVEKFCLDFLRTVPVLQRSEKDPDDLRSGSEDHVVDEVRYALRYDRPALNVSGRVEFGTSAKLRR